jgi:hypothetical protein
LVLNKIEKSIDNLVIHKYKAANYHLKKIVNQKLNKLANPGEIRNYLTKIKVYACFLKIGEIGKTYLKHFAKLSMISKK